VGGETSNLVTHTLGGGDGNLINKTLVGVEVESKTGVVLLDDSTCGLLDGLGADSLYNCKKSIIKEGNGGEK
jgi:hypothetical protein